MLEESRNLDKMSGMGCARDAFLLPEGLVYLCGHSLGAVPKRTAEKMKEVVEEECGKALINGWNERDWMKLPRSLGRRIGKLIGAKENEVVVCDSTTLNLYKALKMALAISRGKKVILTDRENFPADIYIAEGMREGKLRLVGEDEVISEIKEDVGVVMVTHVNYRTSRIRDVKGIVEAARRVGALVILDLAHSVGVMPINLDDLGVDFGVGCSYKYLNGGPGAPGFVYVAERHLMEASPEIYGWMGHEEPFKFSLKYKSAKGIEKMMCGTPPVFSLKGVEAGLEVIERYNLQAIREKSLEMSEYLIKLMDKYCPEMKLISPRDGNERGGHVGYSHEEGYKIRCALEERGIIVDYREPGCLRFGISALYNFYEDMARSVMAVREILDDGEFKKKEYRKEGIVT